MDNKDENLKIEPELLEIVPKKRGDNSSVVDNPDEPPPLPPTKLKDDSASAQQPPSKEIETIIDYELEQFCEEGKDIESGKKVLEEESEIDETRSKIAGKALALTGLVAAAIVGSYFGLSELQKYLQKAGKTEVEPSPLVSGSGAENAHQIENQLAQLTADIEKTRKQIAETEATISRITERFSGVNGAYESILRLMNNEVSSIVIDGRKYNKVGFSNDGNFIELTSSDNKDTLLIPAPFPL